MSLRQVLGEKLEQEIFPGEGVSSVDFPKDDPSPSKRWSVSSFPPQISTGPNITNGTTTTSSSSTWGGGAGHHPPSRHSVSVSPFHQGDTAISDLAASWPIWTSTVPTPRQPQSPFSPSSSLPTGTSEDGWSMGGGERGAPSQLDLVELMKSLDIAEHIPALKVGGVVDHTH